MAIRRVADRYRASELDERALLMGARCHHSSSASRQRQASPPRGKPVCPRAKGGLRIRFLVASAMRAAHAAEEAKDAGLEHRLEEKLEAKMHQLLAFKMVEMENKLGADSKQSAALELRLEEKLQAAVHQVIAFKMVELESKFVSRIAALEATIAVARDGGLAPTPLHSAPLQGVAQAQTAEEIPEPDMLPHDYVVLAKEPRKARAEEFEVEDDDESCSSPPKHGEKDDNAPLTPLQEFDENGYKINRAQQRVQEVRPRQGQGRVLGHHARRPRHRHRPLLDEDHGRRGEPRPGQVGQGRQPQLAAGHPLRHRRLRRGGLPRPGLAEEGRGRRGLIWLCFFFSWKGGSVGTLVQVR